MRLLVATSILLLSSAACLAEVSQDCRASDPARAVSGCTVFLQTAGISRGDQALAHTLRADAFIAQNQLEAGAKDLERALQLAPNNPAALTGRGRLHFLRGDHMRALADVESVLRQTPNAAVARRLRGSAHMELNNYADAKAD